MNRSLASLLVASATLMLLANAPLASQEKWKDVRYASGLSSKPEEIKGTLRITDTELQLVNGKGEPEIGIPLNSITNVGNSATRHDASVGKKLLFGVFAGSKVDEYVNIAYLSIDGPQVVIFKVKENKSLEIATRVQYRAQKGGAHLDGSNSILPPGATADEAHASSPASPSAPDSLRAASDSTATSRVPLS